MRRILIFTILLILLAAPVLAGSHGSPNGHSTDSTAYYAYQLYWGCAFPDVGYSTIGCVVSTRGPHNGGISWYAHEYQP